MPISVACPECGGRVRAPDDLAGRKTKCPKCNASVRVPDDPDEDSPMPPPSRRRGKPEPAIDHVPASRYVEANLGSGEFVVFVTRLHWAVVAKAAAKSLALVVAALLAACAVAWACRVQSERLGEYARFFQGSKPIYIAMAASAMGGLLLYMPAAVFRYFTSDFAVTNKRVIIKDGFLARRSLELFIGKVESVGVDQGFLGRMLGYGDIVVNGSGGTKERFSGIARPMGFRRTVQEMIP